ncbi:hypothetical protein C0Q63_01195 [Streptomyces albidoflavus]|nr:hypothetical protein C0Q63_01195 [Streptomyces albidoflavus]
MLQQHPTRTGPRCRASRPRPSSHRLVELDLSGIHHLDDACRTAPENWAERHSASGPSRCG